MLTYYVIVKPKFYTLASSGKWTSWSTWSSCSRDCVRHKRRSCSDPKPSNGGPKCDGQNHDVEVCTGGMCTGIFCLDNYKVYERLTKDFVFEFTLLIMFCLFFRKTGSFQWTSSK